MKAENLPCCSPFSQPWSPAGYQVVKLADEKVPTVGYQTVKVGDETVPVGKFLQQYDNTGPAPDPVFPVGRQVVVVAREQVPVQQNAFPKVPASTPPKKSLVFWGFLGLAGVVGLSVSIAVASILVNLAGNAGETPKGNGACAVCERENYGTQINFVRNTQEAVRLAKAERKLTMILHVSGNFEDAKFTWNNAEALRVSALADHNVGVYLNRHFVSAFQKVATFQIDGNNQKQGGNVASYFCTPDGRVLHAVAGPVDGGTFLREAHWANETYQLALQDNHKTLEQMQAFFRKAHLDRLQIEQRAHLPLEPLPIAVIVNPHDLGQLLDRNANVGLSNQGKVHLLLAAAPVARLDQVYQVLFEKILNEKVSTDPVAVAGR